MRHLLPAIALALCGCFPQFDDTPWLVDAPRILAVRGDPAEAEPLERVIFDALVATPDGTSVPIEWAFCLRPRTLEERNGVAPECLQPEGEAIQPLGGPSGEIPLDACARFGPNPPPAEPDQPPLRPADPDTTGGYYLPVRASIPEASLVTFGFERLRCSLAGAPRDVFREYQERYANNVNPRIEAVELVEGNAVAPGREVTVRVRTSTASAESYVQYDQTSVAIVDRVETLVVSWFTNAGRFELERRGLTEEEIAAGVLSVENRWTAPPEARSVIIWAVLRDSRGGVDWQRLELEVQ